jgi:hypothetical protein
MKNLLPLLLLSFAACNPYNKLPTRPPVSAKDSLNLANRCDQTFPSTPEYIEGETKWDTLYLEPPSEIDLGEAGEILQARGYDLDSLERVILSRCRPKEIRSVRVDTLLKPDSIAYYRERRARDEAVKIAAKAIADKEHHEKRMLEKYSKHSMYKFAFYFYPIWLIVCILLYFWAKNKFKIPGINFIKRMI